MPGLVDLTSRTLNQIARRSLHLGVIALSLGILPTLPSALAAESLQFEAKDELGIRRYSTHFTTQVPLTKPIPEGTGFQLKRGDKVVPAQFTMLGTDKNGIAIVELDYADSFAPHEGRFYTVEYGPDIKTSKPGGGLAIKEEADQYAVAGSIIPKDLKGLIRVWKRGKDYLVPDASRGLFIRTIDGKTVPVGGEGFSSKIRKPGPIQAEIEFTGETDLGDGRKVNNRIVVIFPQKKSGFYVDWSIDDPAGLVAAQEVSVQLKLEPKPRLADFGAGSWVYVALNQGEAIAYRAGFPVERDAGYAAEMPFWEIFRGEPGKMQPYASSLPVPLTELDPGYKNMGYRWGTNHMAQADGWGHLADGRLCTAVGIEEFGNLSQDWIKLSPTGQLDLERIYAEKGTKLAPGTRNFDFWYHFVPNPPHVGAITLPQVMSEAPAVRWITDKPADK